MTSNEDGRWSVVPAQGGESRFGTCEAAERFAIHLVAGVPGTSPATIFGPDGLSAGIVRWPAAVPDAAVPDTPAPPEPNFARGLFWLAVALLTGGAAALWIFAP